MKAIGSMRQPEMNEGARRTNLAGPDWTFLGRNRRGLWPDPCINNNRLARQRDDHNSTKRLRGQSLPLFGWSFMRRNQHGGCKAMARFWRRQQPTCDSEWGRRAEEATVSPWTLVEVAEEPSEQFVSEGVEGVVFLRTSLDRVYLRVGAHE